LLRVGPVPVAYDLDRDRWLFLPRPPARLQDPTRVVWTGEELLSWTRLGRAALGFAPPDVH
jgi:hypothetical protein